MVLPKPFDIQDMSRALATRRNTPALPPIVEEKQDDAVVLMAVSAAAADA